MEENERIGPINGHNYRGPDIVVNGCLWVVGIAFAFLVVFGLLPVAFWIVGETVEHFTP